MKSKEYNCLSKLVSLNVRSIMCILDIPCMRIVLSYTSFYIISNRSIEVELSSSSWIIISEKKIRLKTSPLPIGASRRANILR